MNPPIVNLDLEDFWKNPYPALASMRAQAPICYVPQLQATLLTLHDDVFQCEKITDVFSSDQPGGLMNVLMGKNMMRKDGDAHILERRQAQPALSPRSVQAIWRSHCERETDAVLDKLKLSDTCDLVRDYAMPVSAHALRHITGLTNMTPEQLDTSSQSMIDGIANYSGDPIIQQRCNDGTQLIDDCIDNMLKPESNLSDSSLLSVLIKAKQPMDSIRANIKLAISGGQNEPRDAIAGTVWALLTHPKQLQKIRNDQNSYLDAFNEFARWISPIGMSPRRIAKSFNWKGLTLQENSRAFLMFGSANRDDTVFANPDQFDLTRNTSKAVSFGAGPHFCAGAAASRMLIGDVALPRLFDRFPKIEITAPVPFGGWAFRGPLAMHVTLNTNDHQTNLPNT